MASASLTRLQAFFRTLFQFDLADLDFGLYRLFRLEQAAITTFIDEDLPRAVDDAFAHELAAENAYLHDELAAATTAIQQQLAADAILPTGELKLEYQQSQMHFVRELAARYETARTRVQAIQASEGHKAEVFNHLVTFFDRYYDAGDFIPKRRYGARPAYAVPYNGEEIFFTWANRDQHYVKSAERFRDYAFTVGDLLGEHRVRFTLAEAATARDNTKGSARYFFPLPGQMHHDAAARTLTLPFAYRLPTATEAEQYGARTQEAILEAALPDLLAAVPDASLRGLLAAPVSDEPDAPPLLLRRVRHFCRRNSSDYFIHKDLRGFLTGELEFYIKEQVLHLMDLEADLTVKRRVVRTFRTLAMRVIEFLAVIEDAQRTLFEKKKFVLATDYLIPIQHIPADFWAEVLANAGQRGEWQAWYGIGAEAAADLFNPAGEVNAAFLAAHPTLPVHTRHFDRAWVQRLLAALPFPDLDAATDGLLVHGENYQALNLLLERYREQVQCIYIDPPYNTGSDDFIYKDRYQHSSWLAMMEARLLLAKELLHPDGALWTSLDDHESGNLRFLGELVFGCDNFVGDVAWQKVYSPRMDAKQLSTSYDHTLVFSRNNDWRPNHRIITPNLDQFPHTDTEGRRYRSDPLRKWGKNSLRQDRPKLWYPIKAPSGDEVWPLKPDGTQGRWRWEKATVDKRHEELDWLDKGNGLQPYVRQYADESDRRPFETIWFYTDAGSTHEAQEEIKSLFSSAAFTTPKPTKLVQLVQQASTQHSDVILDFFAGSGTTGHAVINLNRADGGQRKFLLVEMGDYFDTVLLPRIAKVIYTPAWKEGKPQRAASAEEAARTPRLVKLLRLESYDDALHNLAATAAQRAASPAAQARTAAVRQLAGEEAWRLRYWIELPLQEAATCLRTFDLAQPFAYTLETLTDAGPVAQPVDVVETFTLLYGLRVRRYLTWQEGARAYRVVQATDRTGRRRILVLWRDMAGVDPVAERAFLESQLAALAEQGDVWDEVLINGDSATPGVASLDPLFKRLMMGEGA